MRALKPITPLFTNQCTQLSQWKTVTTPCMPWTVYGDYTVHALTARRAASSYHIRAVKACSFFLSYTPMLPRLWQLACKNCVLQMLQMLQTPS